MTLFQKDFEVIVLFIEHKYITGFLVFTGSFWDIKIVQFCLVYFYFFPMLILRI